MFSKTLGRALWLPLTAVVLACPGPDLVSPPAPPPAPPGIVVDASVATFTGTIGNAQPIASADIHVTQSGTGSLGTLAASVAYSGANAASASWLTATLSGPAAPSLLTLKVALGTLPAGTYTATVTVGSSNAGVSAQAVSVTFVVNAAPPPGTPFGLEAIAISPTQVSLTWTNGSPLGTTIRMERCTGVCVYGFSPVGGWVPGTSTISRDDSALPSTTYTYRIYATSPSGNSGYSNLEVVTTPLAPPPAPMSLNASVVSSGRIDLTWALTGGSNETGFVIYRCIGSGCTSLAEHDRVGAGSLGYQDVGLDVGTTYTYRVKAENSAGLSGYSGVKSATTYAAREPSDLRVTNITSSAIQLEWTDNSDNESSFTIEVCSGVPETCAYRSIGTGSPYPVTGLNPATLYRFRVRANAFSGGSSGWSNQKSWTTSDVAPTAPSNLTATVASGSEIDLTWKDNSTNEAKFFLERCVATFQSGWPVCNGTWVPIGPADANATTYSATGLNPGTTYFFRVKAWNSAGHSGYSNTYTARTLAN